jgi:hypothetical protein
VLLGVLLLAIGTRLWQPAGLDLPVAAESTLGRAPRVDAYWYVRPSIDIVRGIETDPPAPGFANRPLYRWWCAPFYWAAGTGVEALRLPSIVAAALACVLVVLLGRAAGLSLAWAAVAGALGAVGWLLTIHDREPLVYATLNAAMCAAALAWTRGLPRNGEATVRAGDGGGGAPARGGTSRQLWLTAGWCMAIAAAALLKETAAILLPAFAFAHAESLVGGERRRLHLVVFGAVAALVGLVLVLFPEQWADVGDKLLKRSHLGALDTPGEWIDAFAELALRHPLSTASPVAWAAGFLGLAMVVLGGRPRDGDRAARVRRMLAVWCGLGAVAASLMHYRPARYTLLLVPPALVLAAYALAVLRGSIRCRVQVPRGRAPVYVGLLCLMLATAALLALERLTGAWGPVLPSWLPQRALRLGVAAALATLGGVTLARWLLRRGTWPAWPRLALVLVAVTVGMELYAQKSMASLRLDTDLRGRRSFEEVVGPGARVGGYGAHWFCLSEERTPAFRMRFSESRILENPGGLTHWVTFWVPELAYTERLAALAGRPLELVCDLPLTNEMWRVYRLAGAEESGYQLTPFERARRLEDRGRKEEARAAYLALVGEAVGRPGLQVPLAEALGRLDPAGGLRLLQKAVSGARQNDWNALRNAAALLRRIGRDESAAKLERRASRISGR